jgi:hypothetical protein
MEPTTLSPAGAGLQELSAEQIIERNEAARGGVAAWRSVETMVWVGHLETATGPVPLMPFVLEQKRPNLTRFEVTSKGRRTLHVFDGAHGWKLHPGHDGKPRLDAYTPQELRFAKEAPGLEGVLIDHQTKGVAVALEGVEILDGRKSYRLSLHSELGQIQKVWIDAQSFLEIRYDRVAYGAAGAPGMVSVYYSDYRDVQGRQIPHVVQIGVGSGKVPDRMTIERLTINAPINDRLFSRPKSPDGMGRGEGEQIDRTLKDRLPPVGSFNLSKLSAPASRGVPVVTGTPVPAER